MGVMVDYVDLGPKRHGDYTHPDLIRLNPRCRQDQLLSALAHEFGHAVYCEDAKTANCKRADEIGGSYVVTEREYEIAEGIYGPHPGAIARHLGVTPRLVLGWQRWHDRTHPPVAREAD